MKWPEVRFIIFSFLTWRLGLLLILCLTIKYFPLQNDFLGGAYGNYIQNPLFWAWGNFDGQHYTNIAQNGYSFGEYTFFPVYPILIRIIGNAFGGGLPHLYLAGNIISNISIILALFGFYKLARLDYSVNISKKAIILLLLFPTSFYFVAVYTESLFFALVVWAFYLYRSGKILFASILAALAAGTRSIGIFILPAFLLEWGIGNYGSKLYLKKIPVSLMLIPTGLMAYMYYLRFKVNDAFAFFAQQRYVGEHRSSRLISLPQTVYRYLFKVLPNLNYGYLPGTFFTLFEFIVGIIYFIIAIAMFFLVRPSYSIFAFFAYLTPTLLGSFSSMPRYVLIVFPVYFVMARYLSGSKIKTFAFCLFSFILLVISFSLFSRGYWLS